MLKRLAAAIAAVFICLRLFPSAGAEGNVVIRVGLFFGKAALPGINLENAVGSGYRFGYFDENKNFVQLGYTDKTKVSVVKNRNVYFSASSGNYGDDKTDIAVGSYSVELPGSYGSAEEAKAAADALSVNGQPAFAAYTAGVFTIRLNSYVSSSECMTSAAALGGTSVTGSKYCVSVVETGTNNILFQFDQGDSRGFGIMPSLGGEDRPITWSRGYSYAGGFEYRRMDENNLTVINYVSIEDYVKGVLPYEMNANWNIEALKAQALCARSYAYYNLNKHKSGGYDLCNDIDCQAYHGTKLETDNSNAAVDQTAGLYVMYEGKVCNATFHSSNGGSTENSENVWYEVLPYLRAVPDFYEDLDTSLNGRWQNTITNDMLTDILNLKGHENSGIVSMTAQYTEAGNVYSLTMTDSSGKSFTFSKERVRSILNSSKYNISTYSQRYTVNSGQTLSLTGANGTVTRSDLENIYILGAGGVISMASAATNIISAGGAISSVPQTSGDGTYLIQGTGWGHNVGMSQNGAKAMAGLGLTYEDIIKYYFTGVYVGMPQ